MKDYLRLVRIDNLVFIGVLMWVMTYWLSSSVLMTQGFNDLMPWWIWLMLTLGTILIAAGGYVINDYFDVKIDRINRPDKLIVTRTVSKDSAMTLFYIVTGIGIVLGLICSWYLRSSALALIYLLVPGLLWFYSASYKRILLLGNILIAFISALPPIVIAISQTAWLQHLYGKDMLQFVPIGHDLFVWLSGFSLFAFITTLIREIIKDMQDQNGDRELECHTLPVVVGDKWTKIIVTMLIVIMIGVIVLFWWNILPFDRSFSSFSTRYLLFGIIIPLLCELALLWSARIPSDFRTAQGLMKFIMFVGTMYSFCCMRMLFQVA